MIRGEGHKTAAVDHLYQEVRESGVASIAISAPRSGQGVSYLSVALARRMAEAGIRTLLVDFNLLTPNVHELVGLPMAEWWPGDQAAIDQIENVEQNFDVLAASDYGGAHVAFHERAALNVVLQEWTRMYQCVVLDCAPLLESDPDGVSASLLTSLCDAGLMVVKSGEATQPDIRLAMRLLEEDKANLLGLVMNDMENPPLANELQRQAGKLARYAPKLSELLKRWIANSIVLKGDR